MYAPALSVSGTQSLGSSVDFGPGYGIEGSVSSVWSITSGFFCVYLACLTIQPQVAQASPSGLKSIKPQEAPPQSDALAQRI